MTIINQAFRTVTCDGPNCDKTVTFDASQGLPPEILEANPWLKSNRAIQTADGRLFSYCSDVCEVNGTGTGNHNAPEPKQVAQATGAAAIAQAAAEARRKQITNEKIKNGESVQVALG